jgi:hypothetical protein
MNEVTRMWGNKLGWGISAGMAIVMVGLMVLLQWAGTTPSDMTPLFAKDPTSLAALALPIAPETVITTMTDACDAADKYREAIAECQSNPGLYDHFDAKNVENLKACDLVVEATKCKDMTLFTKDAAKVINFDREKTPIEALRKVGEITATKASYLAAKKDYDGARRYAEAAFALGAKMYNERIVYEELDAGLGIMGAGAGSLLRIAKESGDTAAMSKIQAFDEGRRAYFKDSGRPYDLHRITKSIDGNTSGARAGDVFALAEKSKERLWRVEACLQLARTKHNVGEEGKAADQRHAQILLRKLADSDPDPIVRTAAARARDITELEYNTQ